MGYEAEEENEPEPELEPELAYPSLKKLTEKVYSSSTTAISPYRPPTDAAMGNPPVTLQQQTLGLHSPKQNIQIQGTHGLHEE